MEPQPQTQQLDPGLLSPPVVSSLRGDTASDMQRSLSQDIREERDDLREAAEQTLNAIMDLNLDGTIRWVGPSWNDVLGSEPEAVQGAHISDLIASDNKTIFTDIVESMKKDDSQSQIVRFAMTLGPKSKLLPTDRSAEPSGTAPPDIIDLEAQGIMVHDTGSGGESHTMWMIRPWMAPREIKIDLPRLIVDSLGSGAEILASYLTQLAESGLDNPGMQPAPQPVLCRICERHIPPWWFEKHTDLCLQEHTAEMEVQMAQDNLTEHRHAIVKVLDALEARKSRSLTGDAPPALLAEYKGLPIGPPPSSNSSSSATSSPSPAAGRSRDRSSASSGFGHARARSFAIRRPQARIVELLLDLCDTAMEISTPAIKESSSQNPGELRTQSPQSESRISQVAQWQSPSTNTLEQEQGLAALCADSEKVAKAKVEAVLRHRRIIEYAERIRVEFSVIVQDCIDDAMCKAAKIASGSLSDSTESAGDEVADDDYDGAATPANNEEAFFTGSFDAPSKLAMALERAKISDDPENRRLPSAAGSSVAESQKSASPMECPTPKSTLGAKCISAQRHSRRGSMLLESDAGDSDGSIRSSSVVSRPPPRTESPISEFGDLRRQASSRQHHRRSLILPGAISPHRQESPSRTAAQTPSSPLRINKPRNLTYPPEGVVSPEASPMLPSSEFGSPYLISQYQPQPSHHYLHHHRRQSSISVSASGEVSTRPPPSPRLNAVGAPPMARAVPPSIKDFEVIKPISKGAFGSVYLSKKKSTGEYFAIKVLKKADMVAKNQVTNVKAERAIMMWQGESDFVAKLYWTFSSKDYLYLVMEYLSGGDCASLIKVLGCLPEDWVKRYLGEVVLGVEHLHGRGIVHRDLKPDNLLIDQKGHLKLTDFGLSRMGLVGRQKRALNSATNEPVPDLLKQGPFARSTSINSSRSTSLDLHGVHAQSPGGTPLMTPSDAIGSCGQPSYFNLGNAPPENRLLSGHRSDSGGSESLSHMISNLSLNDVTSMPHHTVQSPHGEGSEGDSYGSPDLPSLQPMMTYGSSGPDQGGKGTPPLAGMPPPNWALFDPEDTNRRFVGTPDYLAPETIRGEPQDETSDWWSVGCIMFELLYGIPPFNAGEAERVFENILARRIHWPEEMDDEVSPEAKDLINKLLCMDPRDRLGANHDEKYASGGEEIRSHVWFKDVNWDSLLQDEAQFVPLLENPEDTEYFDARGATLQSFTEEVEDQSASSGGVNSDYADRPHDALSRVRTQANSTKRGLMPLHIPPHVRDLKSRRLSEPVVIDDFGNFAFKNLPVLEKANKDVIQKLRAEALAAQNKQQPALSPGGTTSISSPGPALEGSPVLSAPANQQIQRTMSNAKASQRPQSPSNLSQAASSPSRASQPSSPLLVSFHAGPDSRRKVSNNNPPSTLQQSSTSSSMQSAAGYIEVPRVPPSLQKAASAAMSPSPAGKPRGPFPPLPQSPQKTVTTPRQTSNPATRSRSLTVGSQEGSPIAADILNHRNRRSQVFDMSPSSSDNEGDKANALLLRVQRRRQSSRRMSQIAIDSGPVFRPLDVLICEDHPVSRMVMEKLLEKLRCRTISAASGPEAVRYAMSDIKFDVIFMEYKLPQISGADVARMIRDTNNTNSHTPLVAITAYLKELQARQHFDSLIEKPISSSKLTEVLGSLCHWKPPASCQNMTLPSSSALGHPIPSSLRQESIRLEDSPTSVSSVSANRTTNSFRGSSREDSIGSSLFGDSESVSTDDIPIVIGRKATTGEWDEGGLGISQDDNMLGPSDPTRLQPLSPLATAANPGPGPVQSVSLSAQRFVSASTSASPVVAQPGQKLVSVPDSMALHAPVPVPVPQRSLEKLRAKREAIEKRRHDGSVDSADDEDDELGLGTNSSAVSSGSSSSGSPSSVGGRQSSRQHFRSKSVLPSSKLGIEMMRANSHDSVILHGSENIKTGTMNSSAQTARPTVKFRRIEEVDQTAAAAVATGELDNSGTGEIDLAEVAVEDFDEIEDVPVAQTPPEQINVIGAVAAEKAAIDGMADDETPKATDRLGGTLDASVEDQDPTPRPSSKIVDLEEQTPDGFI
ncbi:serine/threonine-protein kinase [Grosmannia clavigera kw1407]|uniref:non-specific serine/threonine protein kinase n=1 Tax=Grosmannia clavigera (strain kw1407 / UAMH 11150) TaxID=655863 RepID=F0XE17_GROCL|nr:serine/threonine-protein kinase [Grosmannia clavigera kw1407]EFX04022.1 serine/threonine-protein kinase [Grosmannia clavigera kw1407]